MQHAALNLRAAPEYPPRIDWSNPIALDLQRAWYGSHPDWEAVGESGVAPNGVTQLDSLYGTAGNFSAASAAIDLGVVAAVARPITLRVRFISPTASSASYLLACMPAKSGSGWRLECSTTGGGIYPVLTYNAIANYGASPISVSVFGRWQVTDYVVTMSTSTITHYVDGLLNTSSAAASFASAAAGSTLKIGADSGLAQVLSVEYWGRVLQADEISQLAERPIQLIAARRRRLQVVAGGGGDTINAAVGNATAAGSTATVASAITVAATIGNAAAAGSTATVASGITIAATTGNAAAAGSYAAIESSITIGAGIGNATAAGSTAAVTAGSALDFYVGNAVAAGAQATVSSAITISAGVGNSVAAGSTADISTAIVVSAGIGNAAAAGSAASISAATSLAFYVGNAVAAGSTANIEATGALNAAEIADAVWDEPMVDAVTARQIMSGMADFLRSRGHLP